MTTFQDARAFLLQHRTDYDAAVEGFRWPDPVPFNWALDWLMRNWPRNADSKDRRRCGSSTPEATAKPNCPLRRCRAAPIKSQISCARRD